MRINHVKWGIVLAYVLMMLNAIYGFVVTPILIKYAGSGDYGVYKTISSLTSSILILDLGLGDTTMRYVAKFIASREKNRIDGFLSMILTIALCLCGLVSVVCFCVSFFISPLYRGTFSTEQLSLSRIVFLFCSINILVHIISNVFNGVISGFNKFVLSHSISLAKILARAIFGVCVVVATHNILLFVVVDLIISVICLLIEVFCVLFGCQTRIAFTKWDKALFREAFRFSFLMFLSAVASQVCSNLDNIVIGSFCGPDFVTVYSVCLIIFVMFGNISCAVSGVMLPTITNLINNSDEEGVIKLLIKVGRLQFILLSACIVGFAILGRDFLNIWLGEGFDDAYIITLILIVPSIFEYCINTALSILKAKYLLGFRTFALGLACLLNLAVTIVLVKSWSYIGAAIGTSVTYLVCSLIMMNIYYSRKLKLPMFRIYRGIIRKLWLCLLVPSVILLVQSLLLGTSVFNFAREVLLFCVIYAICLLTFGLDYEEKIRIPIVGRFFEKKELLK